MTENHPHAQGVVLKRHWIAIQKKLETLRALPKDQQAEAAKALGCELTPRLTSPPFFKDFGGQVITSATIHVQVLQPLPGLVDALVWAVPQLFGSYLEPLKQYRDGIAGDIDIRFIDNRGLTVTTDFRRDDLSIMYSGVSDQSWFARPLAGDTVTNALIVVLPAGVQCLETNIIGFHHFYTLVTGSPPFGRVGLAWVSHETRGGTFDLDSIMTTLSHELVEMITNPISTDSAILSTHARVECGNLACEIGDVCEGQVTIFPGTSQHPSFAAQKYWSQRENGGSGGCV